MIRKIALSSFVLIVCIVLQSTVFRYFAIYGVVPNLFIVYLVYTSFHNGGLHGAASGFFSGLIEDVISISPLGFHALIKTIVGFIFSQFNGLVVLDRVVMPSVFVLVGTILNRVIAFGAISIFSLSIPVYSIFSKYFLIEICYNVVLTPVIFLVSDKIRLKIKSRGYDS